MEEDFDARRARETIERLTRYSRGMSNAPQLAVNAAHVRIEEHEMEKESIGGRIARQRLEVFVLQPDRARVAVPDGESPPAGLREHERPPAACSTV